MGTMYIASSGNGSRSATSGMLYSIMDIHVFIFSPWLSVVVVLMAWEEASGQYVMLAFLLACGPVMCCGTLPGLYFRAALNW